MLGSKVFNTGVAISLGALFLSNMPAAGVVGALCLLVGIVLIWLDK